MGQVGLETIKLDGKGQHNNQRNNQVDEDTDSPDKKSYYIAGLFNTGSFLA
jgi:hypothetical protein